MTRAPRYPTPATRLHTGRILCVVLLLLGLGIGAWIWAFHRRPGSAGAAAEGRTNPGWTAASLQYEKPEVKAEAPAPKPIDLTAAELARIRAMLAQMQAEIEALKNRKTTMMTPAQSPPVKVSPPPGAPGGMLFVSHEMPDRIARPSVAEYVLAPGAGKLPCIVETSINSEVQGQFTAKVSTNVYDTATGRHLLVPQGSTILGQDRSQDLLYGNERLPTMSLLLTLPDGRSVDLGQSPVTDPGGIMGLTGRVNQHFWRLFGAIFIGGALRGGTQALSTALAQEAGVGQVAAGYNSVVNQALSPRVGRALDTRPTIEIDGGHICNVLLTKPLVLQAMWQ